MWTSATIGVMMGFALAGRAAVTLSCTMCVEKSSSVAFCARWSTMTGLRARGAKVATYWSVLVTVRIAQTEITEIGISSEASTTSTQAVIRLVRGARGLDFGVSSASGRAATAPSGVSSESISLIWARSAADARAKWNCYARKTMEND